MRLVIDMNDRYPAERSCADAKSGQKLLNEKPVSILYLAYRLSGRSTGLDVLIWAKRKHRLPPHIMVTETTPVYRKMLSDFLIDADYVGDGIFFHKLRH